GPSSGERRSGTSRVSSVEGDRIGLAPDPSQPCAGDSGGPVFVDGALTGVTSRGDADCAGGAVAMRVEASRDFIAGWLHHSDAEGSHGCAAAPGSSPPALAFGVFVALVASRRRRGIPAGADRASPSRPIATHREAPRWDVLTPK